MDADKIKKVLEHLTNVVDVLQEAVQTEQLEVKKEDREGKGKQIGVTKKVSITLPEKYWTYIMKKSEKNGSISSTLRELLIRQIHQEKAIDVMIE